MKLKCVRHGIMVDVDGLNRSVRITVPPTRTAARGSGSCALMLAAHPAPGMAGRCEIREVSP